MCKNCAVCVEIHLEGHKYNTKGSLYLKMKRRSRQNRRNRLNKKINFIQQIRCRQYFAIHIQYGVHFWAVKSGRKITVYSLIVLFSLPFSSLTETRYRICHTPWEKSFIFSMNIFYKAKKNKNWKFVTINFYCYYFLFFYSYCFLCVCVCSSFSRNHKVQAVPSLVVREEKKCSSNLRGSKRKIKRIKHRRIEKNWSIFTEKHSHIHTFTQWPDRMPKQSGFTCRQIQNRIQIELVLISIWIEAILCYAFDILIVIAAVAAAIVAAAAAIAAAVVVATIPLPSTPLLVLNSLH